MKKIKIILSLLLLTTSLFSQLPRLRFTQIQQADTSGLVLASDSNYNTSYSTQLRYIGSDLLFGGIKIPNLLDVRQLISDSISLKQDQLNGTGFVKATGTTISYDNSTYLTGNQTITLSGDATGSGTTAITVTVVDDSHNHIISNVDNLQDSLNSRMVTNFSNVSGTLPVANGGTGSTTQNFVDLTNTQTVGGAKTFTSTVTGTRFDPTSSSATGNGMFLPTTNTIGFSTNGSERMRIDASGNLGIGTAPYSTFPDSKLHVYGTRSNTINSANAIAKIGGQDVYINFGVLNGTPNFGTWIQAARFSDDLEFSLALNPNGGNVGIGTTSPSTLLDVNGTVTGGKFVPTANTVTGNGMYLPTTNTLGFSTNGSERMRITSGGDVGINTNTPGAKFHISAGYGLINNAYSWAIYNTTSNAFAAQFGAAGDVNFFNFGNNAIIAAAGSNNILFGTNANERMRIDASGNVGIGTTSPTAALHLKAGTASANTAPLKFTSGTNLTAAEAGAMEYDGTDLFITKSDAVRRAIVTGTGTSGQVSFWNGTTTQSSDGGLIWDNTNKRLGINTSPFNSTLEIVGNYRVGQNSGVGGDNLIGGIIGVSNGFLTRTDTLNAITYQFHSGSNQIVLELLNNAKVRLKQYGAITDLRLDANGEFFDGASDERLKNSIENINYGINEIMLLQPKQFWRNDEKQNYDLKEVGFVAQDVRSVIPNAVVNSKSGYFQLRTDAILATSVKAIQEQQTIIQSQATEIEILKTQIQLILNEIQILKNN